MGCCGSSGQVEGRGCRGGCSASAFGGTSRSVAAPGAVRIGRSCGDAGKPGPRSRPEAARTPRRGRGALRRPTRSPGEARARDGAPTPHPAPNIPWPSGRPPSALPGSHPTFRLFDPSAGARGRAGIRTRGALQSEPRGVRGFGPAAPNLLKRGSDGRLPAAWEANWRWGTPSGRPGFCNCPGCRMSSSRA
jgi:hypothetical protein